MTFDKGSLIIVDYTAKVKDSNEVFDTTIEEDAKKHSIYEQNVKYQPKLVSLVKFLILFLKDWMKLLQKHLLVTN